MIVGSPENFAIWLDPVDSWSSYQFNNGCLAYFIGGRIFLSIHSTIDVDVSNLAALRCMSESIDDEELFSESTLIAYEHLCARAFPDMDSDMVESDFTHFVSTESLSDNGHNIFLVESAESSRVIYGFGGDLSTVFDVSLRKGEFQSIVRKLIDKWALYVSEGN